MATDVINLAEKLAKEPTMFLRTKLACSFCGKSADEVSKLVAGPKVYICDACVAAAARIMDGSEPPEISKLTRVPGVWRRILDWFFQRASIGHPCDVR